MPKRKRSVDRPAHKCSPSVCILHVPSMSDHGPADDMELTPENLLPTELVRFLSMVMAGKEDMETNEKMKRLVFPLGKTCTVQCQRENGSYQNTFYSV
ncbi:hypothetical protein CgunFtcFv8_020083 [Champsocephalus gunnari]|uniref:Uncharacterized protein n=1 Tax=Champsocephalus gunnari TaxID=52237 RepID=A0AAN8HSU9_CHAGU|nr:hypothetical protein CgunFtcFv8_020083 [Champsocephalus gunnari]